MTAHSPAAVLGVQMRGTDKFLKRKVGPDEYFPMIDSYIQAKEVAGGAHVAIFLAT